MVMHSFHHCSRLQRCRGISALEIAVLLVLAGMLSCGVWMVMEYATSSKLRNLTAQISRYDSAVIAFQEKYSFWPGDLPNAESLGLGYGTGGNGNGVLQDSQGRSGLFTSEIAAFWQHLSNAKFIDEVFDGVSNRAGGGFPLSAFEKGGIVAFGEREFLSNYYQLTVVDNMIDNKIATMPLFEPDEAYRIDAKFDDGIPHEGRVRAYHGTVEKLLPVALPGQPGCVSAYSGSTKAQLNYSIHTQMPLCELRVRSGG